MLDQVKAEAEAAKEAKKAANKAKAETERAAKKSDENKKKAANYPQWEAELRAEYKDVGLSEAELQELILRDRVKRLRQLPKD